MLGGRGVRLLTTSSRGLSSSSAVRSEAGAGQEGEATLAKPMLDRTRGFLTAKKYSCKLSQSCFNVKIPSINFPLKIM